jgi:hypothetical protein
MMWMNLGFKARYAMTYSRKGAKLAKELCNDSRKGAKLAKELTMDKVLCR